MDVTILDDGTETAVAAQVGPEGRILLTPEAAERALGWVRKPHGWCRDELCVPSYAAAKAEHEGLLDPVAFAEILDRPAATDTGVVAIGVSAQERSLTLAGTTAPDFSLPDVDGVRHALSDLRGRKVALVFWGSWCGCRYDLPEWERRHAALAEHGFSVLSVAVDRRIADAAPWIAEAAVTHTALVDTDGAVADLYDVLNVPTVLWIDEEGRIVRPHDTQFATDLFRELSGLDSGAALAALDRWVLTGETGLSAEDVALHTRRATASQQSARTEAALGLWLHRNGRTAEAERHFARAEQLAPEDLTIWRGTMPLRGVDPMGDEYFAKRTALTEAGIPIYRPLGDWQPT
ncbi:redoxin domain-containing protein [Streptomyces sp. NPDC054956]